MSAIDMNYIESIRNLGRVESKAKLYEYAEQFDVQLKKTKSFDNMVADLQEALVDQKGYKSTADMIDEYEKQESERLQLLTEDTAKEHKTAEVEEFAEDVDKPKVEDKQEPVQEDTDYFLPENFIPSFSLIGNNPAHYTLPWWLHEWIVHNEDWKSNISAFPHKQEINTLYGLLYYIKKNGSVTIRETRNSKYFTLT